MHPGADAHVDHEVGAADRIFIMLDHQYTVADVTQMLERRDQAVIVALVQSDGRFIENIHHTGQAGSDL